MLRFHCELRDYYNGLFGEFFEGDDIINLTDRWTAKISTHAFGLMHLLRDAFYPSGKFDSWKKSIGGDNLKTIESNPEMTAEEK